MIRDEQLIFYIGAPGSGWAKLSTLLSCCSKLKLNTSDRSKEREETCKVSDKVVHHEGAFWDPGMEFGEGFNDIKKNYSKESFIEECLKPFKDINTTDNYLIKSHFFAEPDNLFWLRQKFPNNKIIFVLRRNDLCFEGWDSGMTFTQHYPKYYAWMYNRDNENDPRNYEKLKQLIEYHNYSISKFIKNSQKSTIAIVPTKYFLDQLGYIWDNYGELQYEKLIEIHQFYKADYPAYDTPIIFYNCNDIFTIKS